MSTPQMDAWVFRMLRVPVDAGGARSASSNAPATLTLRAARPVSPAIRHVSVEGRARWQEARERVDAQLGRLIATLDASGDPTLERIADLGLAGLTGGLNTTLVGALIDVDAAPPDRRDAARSKAQGAIAALHRLLASDPVIALMEDNPLGVPVDIRGTLGDALRHIEGALA